MEGGNGLTVLLDVGSEVGGVGGTDLADGVASSRHFVEGATSVDVGGGSCVEVGSELREAGGERVRRGRRRREEKLRW